VARPTGRGLALLATAAATYIAARVVGTWELYLVAVALAATALVAWLAVTVTARRLGGARSVTPTQPLAGDPVSVSIRFSNGSLLPGPQLAVSDAAAGLSGDGGEVQVESLRPRARRVVASPPLPARRGVHRLPALFARAEDPLGLARAERRLGDPLEVVVYPRLAYLQSCLLFPGMGARRERGMQGLSALGASEFRGVRPHNPGEPLNHIDWKSTAKTGSLMLREMDDPASGDVTVLLDGSSSLVAGEPPETNLELAVQAAGSIADFALRAGRGVSLRLPQDDWRRTRLAPGADGRARLLESLARVAPHPAVRLGPSLRTLLAGTSRRGRSSAVALVVLGIDAELVQALVGLRARGLQVSVVHVEAASFGPQAAASAPKASPAATESLHTSPATAESLHASTAAALAAAGVRCLTLRRGDDLRAALSLGPAEARWAEPPRAVVR
jgi:uncharacterized protein (DUF58 family)